MKDIQRQIDSKPKGKWAGNQAGNYKRNQSKAYVLAAVQESRFPATVLDVQLALPHMTEGQIRGVLQRGVEAKRPYIEKKGDPYSPNSFRYRYRLTLRGQMWIRWAEKVGLIATDIPEEDDDDDDDDEEMAWLNE